MGNYRFQLNAKSVDINPVGSHHICLTIDIYEYKIDNLLEELPIKKIHNFLDATNTFTPEFLLKHCTLEEIFDQFNPVELKNRLAQYLIDIK
jgi:hypothetical protein